MSAKIGRPGVEITEEVTDEICDRLIGGESMGRICRDAHMPAASSVYLKMANDEPFRSRIARSREAQQDAEMDAVIDMADEATIADWQVVKLRIWARQWRASKLAPKKYGDKVGVEGTGADGALVVQINKQIFASDDGQD